MSRQISLLQEIRNKIDSLKKSYNFSEEEAIQTLEDYQIPLSVFNRKISSLETIVKYLKEEKGLNYKQISLILDRSYDTIALTYRNSKKKNPEQLDVKSIKTIPVSITANEILSTLESIVFYLKETENLSFKEISNQILRDQRTVWTVFQRARRKLQK